MRVELIEKLKSKVIFFDIDGTLSEYRFNDHVKGDDLSGGQTIEELLFRPVFFDNRPLKVMIDTIQNLNPDRIFVIGAITTNFEMEQKYRWLEKHYPSIKKENVIFVASSELKVLTLEAYSKHLSLEHKEMVIVDDLHATIRLAEERGFMAYHVTSFMD